MRVGTKIRLHPDFSFNGWSDSARAVMIGDMVVRSYDATMPYPIEASNGTVLGYSVYLKESEVVEV